VLWYICEFCWNRTLNLHAQNLQKPIWNVHALLDLLSDLFIYVDRWKEALISIRYIFQKKHMLCCKQFRFRVSNLNHVIIYQPKKGKNKKKWITFSKVTYFWSTHLCSLVPRIPANPMYILFYPTQSKLRILREIFVF